MSLENWQTRPMSDSTLYSEQLISSYCGVPLSELVMQSDSSCGFINACANSAGEMGALNLCHMMEEKPSLGCVRSEFNGTVGTCFSTLMSNIDPHKLQTVKQVQETQFITPYLQPDMFYVGQEQSVDCFSNPQICASSLFQSFTSTNSDIISPSSSARLQEATVEAPLHHMPRHFQNYFDNFASEDLFAQDSDSMPVGFYNNSLSWQLQPSIEDQKNSGQIQYTQGTIRNEDSKDHELQFSLPHASRKRSYTINIEDGMQPCAKKLISWSSGSSSCSTQQSKSPKLRSARVKQGSAMDPQSVAARLRRERISERLKILQELVPNGSKFDLVTMLEKAINYVKFLQLQVKVLTTDEYWPNKDSSTSAAIVKVQDVLQEIASTRSSLAGLERMSIDNKNKIAGNFETN